MYFPTLFLSDISLVLLSLLLYSVFYDGPRPHGMMAGAVCEGYSPRYNLLSYSLERLTCWGDKVLTYLVFIFQKYLINTLQSKSS